MGGYAWVTLATNNSYSLGALVLAHSLKKANTVHKLAVLITPAVSQSMRDQLQTVFDLVRVVDVLDSKDEAHLALLKRPDLGITFTKIHCWRLTEFEKCVFLDADTLVVRNCDELFEKEEFSAAPDVSWPDCFNSGVFVYRPSVETFNKILQFAAENRSFDGGDQGLLNQYFSDWATEDIKKHLPFVYNLTTVAAYSYIPAFKHYGSETRIVHFIGTDKPWLQQLDVKTRTVSPSSGSEHLAPVLQQWWDLFCEKVQPNLDKNLESNNDGMSHPPAEANSFPVALTDEPEPVRLIEPTVTYREKDDFRQHNLPYQPFDVKGPSGELLNVEFLLASVVLPPEETVVRSDEQQRHDNVVEKRRDDDAKVERKESNAITREESQEKPKEIVEAQKVEDNQQQQQQQQQRQQSQQKQEQQPQKLQIQQPQQLQLQQPQQLQIQQPQQLQLQQPQQLQLQQPQQQQQQEEPPPPLPPDPFDYNSFFPDETCIRDYLEKNVVTYQPFENHHDHVERDIPSLPRFLTIPQNDQRQSENVETQQQEDHRQPKADPPVVHSREGSTEARFEIGSPPKEDIKVQPELSKSKSMSSFPCDVTTPPRLSIWKSQPDVNVDPSRRYSMPRLKPILPKQRSFSRSVPTAIPKVTMYTEVLMSSDYKDPENLPKDKTGFVETHIRREAKLRRTKSDADIRDRFGPLPYGLSPEVEQPVVAKRIPLMLLDNDFYDLAKCKRQMGNKPKPKDSDSKKESICALPALKPIVPAKDKKFTVRKKRQSKELSPGDGGKEKMVKREPKVVRERKKQNRNTPRNVGNGNDLDEILQRLREFSKNYQHFFGVKPTTVKDSTSESNSAIVRESRISKKEIDGLEFRQFRNYVKDRRETSQKGLLNIQDILSEGSESAEHSVVPTQHSKIQSFTTAVEDGGSVETPKRPPLKRQTKISDDIPTMTESASENSTHSKDVSSLALTQQLSESPKYEKVVSEMYRKKKKIQTNCTQSEKKSVVPYKRRQKSKTSAKSSCSSAAAREGETTSSFAVEYLSERKTIDRIVQPYSADCVDLKTAQSKTQKVDSRDNSKAAEPVVQFDKLVCLPLTTEMQKNVENNTEQSAEEAETLRSKLVEEQKESRQLKETAPALVEPVANTKSLGYLTSAAPTESSSAPEEQKKKVESKFERKVTGGDVIAAENQQKTVDLRVEKNVTCDDIIAAENQKDVESKPEREAACDVLIAAETHKKNVESETERRAVRDDNRAAERKTVESKLERNVTDDDVTAAKNKDIAESPLERTVAHDEITATEKQKNVRSKSERRAVYGDNMAAEKKTVESKTERRVIREDVNEERKKIESKPEGTDVRDDVAAENQEKNVTATEKQKKNAELKPGSKHGRKAVRDDVTDVIATNSRSYKKDGKTAAAASSPGAQAQKMQNGFKTPTETKRIKISVEELKIDVKNYPRQETEAKKSGKTIAPDYDTPRTSRVTPPNDPEPSKEKRPTGTRRTTASTHSENGFPAESASAANRKSETFDDRMSASGIAGAIAQLNLESGSGKIPESEAMSTAHQEYLRRQNWETGNVDYMGRDSFDNIWSKICQTIEAKESEETAAERTKQESKQLSTTTEQVEKSPKCPEFIETLPGEPAVGPVEDDEIIFSKPENKQTNLTNIFEEEEAGGEGSAAANAGNVKLSDILQSKLPTTTISAAATPQPAGEMKSQSIPAVVETETQQTATLSGVQLQPTATPAETKDRPATVCSDIKSKSTEMKPQQIPVPVEPNLQTAAIPSETKPQTSVTEIKVQSLATPTEPKEQPSNQKSQTTGASTEMKLQPAEQKQQSTEHKSQPTKQKQQPAEQKQSKEEKSQPTEQKQQSTEHKSQPTKQKQQPAEQKQSKEEKSQPTEQKQQSTEHKSQPTKQKQQPAEQKQSTEEKSQPTEQKQQPTEHKSQPTKQKQQPAEQKQSKEEKSQPTEQKPVPIASTTETKPQTSVTEIKVQSLATPTEPKEQPSNQKSQTTGASTEMKLQPAEQKQQSTEHKSQPTKQKQQPAEQKQSTVEKSQPTEQKPVPIVSTTETKPQPTAALSEHIKKPQSEVTPAEPKSHLTEQKPPPTDSKLPTTAASAEQKPQPAASPSETKIKTEKPEYKASAVAPQLPLQFCDQKAEDTKAKPEKSSGECTTVAIPSPPITFPGSPATKKDGQQSKIKKVEEKPQVVSEPIPLPPPDSPTAGVPQTTEIKTSRSDSLKDDGKQKKGVFTKILEMVGVAQKDKNENDEPKSVFYDVGEATEIEQEQEEKGKTGEGKVKQSDPVEKGEEAKEKPEEKKPEMAESAKTKEVEAKPGRSPFPKPARGSSPKEQKQPTDSTQGKSPSPKLKIIPQNPPETEVTMPTPPPQPDAPATKNLALLKVDDTIPETPPVPEPEKVIVEESALGKVSAEVEDIIGKAKNEVESMLQDRRSGEKDAGESSDLINAMKLMIGSEQPEKPEPEIVEELKVTSEEERKRHKGDAVTSKLSDQILKAIPPPRRKAISEAAASTSAIPKTTAGPEQQQQQQQHQTPPGEGKGKTSKSSSMPVPPPRIRGKPTPPAPSKGKGKK